MTQSRESRNQKGHKKSILILLWSSCTHTSSPTHHQNWQKSIKPCYHSKHNENFYSDLYYSFKGVRYVENGWLVLFALCQIVNMKTIKYLKSQGKTKACFQLITSYSADKPLQMSIFKTVYWATLHNSASIFFCQGWLIITGAIQQIKGNVHHRYKRVLFYYKNP